MAYEIVDPTPERGTSSAYDTYMAEVMAGNTRRRQLSVQRPDVNQPAFSPEAETIRQANAVTQANRVEANNAKSGSGYTIADPADESSKGYSVVDPGGSQGPSTGSSKGLLDRVVETYQSYRPNWSSGPKSEPPTDPMALPGYVLGDLGTTALNVLGEIAAPLATFRDYVQGAATGTPGYPAGPKAMGDIFQKERGVPSTDWKQNIIPGIVEGLDELALPWITGRAPRRPVPSQGRSAPVDPLEPSVSQRVEGPIPSISDLARQEQERQLLSQSGSQVTPRGASPGLNTPSSVDTTPTGSVLRHPLETGQEYPGSDLSTTPTGSLMQLQKPGSVTLDPGYPRVEPGYPSDLRNPQTVESLESRPLHGRQPQGPPSPIHLKSAEELLAEKYNLRGDQPRPYPQTQQQRYQSKIDTTGVPSAADLPPLPRESMTLLAQPEQAGIRGLTSPETALPNQVQPTLPQRLFLHAFDVLDTLGPVSKNISSILRYTYDYSEQGTRQNFLDATALLRRHWGERSQLKALRAAPSIRDALNASVYDYGMTQKEADAVVELLDAGLDSRKISTAGKKNLPVDDPRVQSFAQEFWQVATGRASSHPFIQSKARVYDPITGEQTPVGQPGPYWPHQAANQETKLKLNNEFLRDMYQRGRYEEKGIDFSTFKDKFTDWWKSDNPDIQLRKFAGFEYKRLLDTHADAESHGRTIADSLRHYGYETDPLRMLVKHNMYGLKRAATLEHADTLKLSMHQLADEYGVDSPTYHWIENVVNRSQGISQREDFIHKTSNLWNIAQSIAYPAFLRGSWKQNILLQPNYLVMQTGLQDVTKAVWNYFGTKLGYTPEKIRELSERSGSIFPAFLAKYHTPEGLAQQYTKSMLEMDLFSPSDMATRRLSGMAGLPYTNRIAQEFWKNPADKKWKGLLEELHINPAELYQDLAKIPKEQWVNGLPEVPDKYLMRGAQNIANKSMGRTGIRSMQAWAAGDTELHHVMMMLHRQIASNEGLMIQSILRAPTAGIGIKRALSLMVGAEAAGLMYNGVVNELMGNDFFDVNKSLVKTMGGHKEAALFAKSFLMGIGTFTSGIALMGLNAMGGNAAAPAYAFMSPPIASLTDELINKGLKGDLSGVAKRLLPSEILSTTLTRNEKEERRRRSAGSGMPDPLHLP